MSYISACTPRNFSSLSVSSTQAPSGLRSSAGSMFGGAGGTGARSSSSSVQNLSTNLRPYFQQSTGAAADSATYAPVTNEKETMQDLNTRLDKYMSTVRTLEESNRQLEEKIKDFLKKKGAENGQDYSGYDGHLGSIRKQIRDLNRENSRLLLQIDNARLAADDFKVKYESEQAMRQSVDQDVAGLRKIIDDTKLSHMQMESQYESTNEELSFLQKNHSEQVSGLRGQISGSDVSVGLDSPKGTDISEAINKIRKQYEKIVQKNQEDTDSWYQQKFDGLTAEVSQNTDELHQGKLNLNNLRKQLQSHDVDLQSHHSMRQSLDDTLRDTESRYANDMNTHNQRLQQLESELGQLRGQLSRQASDHQSLLNIKMKLESEIATYQRLLEGGTVDDRVEFSLEQAVQAVPQQQTLKKVTLYRQEVVDGKVTSQMEIAPSNYAEVKVQKQEEVWEEVQQEVREVQQEQGEVLEEVLEEEVRVVQQEWEEVQEVEQEQDEVWQVQQEQEGVQEGVQEVVQEQEEAQKQKEEQQERIVVQEEEEATHSVEEEEEEAPHSVEVEEEEATHSVEEEEEESTHSVEEEEEEAPHSVEVEEEEAPHSVEQEEEEAPHNAEQEEEEASHSVEQEEEEASHSVEVEEEDSPHSVEQEEEEAPHSAGQEEEEAPQSVEVEEEEAPHSVEQEEEEAPHSAGQEEEEASHSVVEEERPPQNEEELNE